MRTEIQKFKYDTKKNIQLLNFAMSEIWYDNQEQKSTQNRRGVLRGDYKGRKNPNCFNRLRDKWHDLLLYSKLIVLSL